MNEHTPFVRRLEDVLSVRLLPEIGELRTVPLQSVVDVTYLGEVVGVEVLDFRRQLSGATAPASPAGSSIRWSYDPEIDAFYLHVTDGPAQVQRDEMAVAYLSSDNQLTGLQLRIPTVDM
jgi:uncharacterized protein YuzE